MISVREGFDRRYLIGASLSAAVSALVGCRSLPEPTGAECDQPAVNGVGWIPDVAHPVWWGEEHLTTADGAPRTLSIYYPSNRVLPPRQMLRSCLGRWPVVLLLHGQPPGGISPAQSTSYNRAFWRIAVALARSGYVVVAPLRATRLTTPESGPAMLAAAQADVNWVRTAWKEAKWVSRAPNVTVVGHSYGALEATYIANNWPEVAALASLGGPWLEPTDAAQTFRSIRVPSLFMFQPGGLGFERIEENPTEAANFWREIPTATYAAIYEGEHFDYLDAGLSGSAPRGPCAQIGQLAADLVALFVAAHVHSLTAVPIKLTKPAVTLSPEQEPFAVQHLPAIDKTWGDECTIKLKWRTSQGSGERMIG